MCNALSGCVLTWRHVVADAASTAAVSAQIDEAQRIVSEHISSNNKDAFGKSVGDEHLLGMLMICSFAGLVITSSAFARVLKGDADIISRFVPHASLLKHSVFSWLKSIVFQILVDGESLQVSHRLSHATKSKGGRGQVGEGLCPERSSDGQFFATISMSSERRIRTFVSRWPLAMVLMMSK